MIGAYLIEIARRKSRCRPPTRTFFAVPILCCVWSLLAAADPILPYLLSDHMALQRGREINIWGKADPAEKISVSLAGHSRVADADSGGRWSVHFAPMPAGGPFTLKMAGRKPSLLKM
jgi:hypothetical protein